METLFAGLFAAVVAAGSPAEAPPEGPRILVPSTRTGASDLFLVDPANANTTNVTRTPGEEEIAPAWSADGKRIAFTSRVPGKTFEVFVCDADGSNRKQISIAPDRPSGATCPSWSPDGKKVVYARGYPGSSFEVRVATVDGSTDEVIRENATFPAWAPDGKSIAFVRLDTPGQKALAVMSPDGTGVKTLVEKLGGVELCLPSWAPDGKVIAYPGETNYGWQLFLIPAAGGSPRQLTQLPGLNFNPVWLGADRLLFTHSVPTGSQGGAYLTIKADGGRLDFHPLTKIEPPHPLLRPAVFLPRPEEVAEAPAHPIRVVGHTEPAPGRESSVRVTPASLVPATGPGAIFSVAWSGDGARMVVGLETGAVLVGSFDGKVIKPVDSFRGHSGAAEGAALSADGSLVYSVGKDKTVRTWEVGAKEMKSLHSDPESGRAVAVSPDGKVLATGETGGVLRLRDAVSGVVSAGVTICEPKRGSVHSVAFGKDGKVVFAGAARWDLPVLNGAVAAVDPATGKLLWRTKGVFGGVFALAVSPDGSKLAGACIDSYVRTWDAKTGAELGCWKGHTDRVTGITWGLDGKVVLSCGFDHTVRVWDSANGGLLHTLAAHACPVVRVAATPDGKHLVSAGQDGIMVIWDMTD